MHLELPVTLKTTNVSLTLQGVLHVLLKAWLVAWPLAFPGGVVVLKCCQSAGCSPPDLSAGAAALLARVRAWFDHVRAHVRPPARYTRYGSAEEEGRRALRASDAHASTGAELEGEGVPLVRYYAPRLLPVYRERAEADPEGTEYALAPRAYCKWHRMVFRGPMHPTLREAPRQIARYSSRDRREIHRISRLARDEDVFGASGAQWTMRYAQMWRRWLDTKGPDVAIVFE
ncbi:hypothetical protein BD413DRAFT_650737 [Trametes elegans]|nr:hypothetical protein BD413DRAFT_650737 [Trametes elegans]